MGKGSSMKLPSLIEVIRGCSDWEYKMFHTVRENNRPHTKGVRTLDSWITINYDFESLYPYVLGDIRPNANGRVYDSQAVGRFLREWIEANPPQVGTLDHPSLIREPQFNGFSIEDVNTHLMEFRQLHGVSIVLSDVHFSTITQNS